MRLLVGSLVIASLVALSPRAIAQPEPEVGSGSEPVLDTGSDAATPTKDPALAKRWLAAAQQLVQKGDAFASQHDLDDAKAQYGNAVIAYTKAIEAGDDIGVHYALALVLDKLGNEADAYKHLKLALAKPDVAKKAQAKLDEIAAKVGTVKLAITPDGAQIALNGTPVGEAPMADPLVLVPGTYSLSLSAGGYQPKDVELKIEAGSESERKIDMQPVALGKPHVVGEPDSEPAAPGSKLSPLVPIIIGGSATVVFVAVATITGVAAISQHRAFTNPSYSPSDRKDAQSTGRLEARINDACFVGAIAAAAFTGGWYWFIYRKQAAQPDQPRAMSKVDLVPWVQPDAGGLFAAGSF